MQKYIIFGISPILSDIFDIIHANHGKVYKIYQNMPEVKKERDLGFRERIALLGYDVKIYDSLDHFEPERGCLYIIGTPSPQKYRLIEEMQKAEESLILISTEQKTARKEDLSEKFLDRYYTEERKRRLSTAMRLYDVKNVDMRTLPSTSEVRLAR